MSTSIALPRKALSVKPPWAQLIIYENKDIENRDWQSSNPALRHRGPTAIHASGKLDMLEYDAALAFIKSRRLNIQLPEPDKLVCGAILGVVKIVGAVRRSDSPWFVGSIGLVLRNPIALPEPIKCKGALGFWDIPTEWRKEAQA